VFSRPPGKHCVLCCSAARVCLLLASYSKLLYVTSCLTSCDILLNLRLFLPRIGFCYLSVILVMCLNPLWAEAVYTAACHSVSAVCMHKEAHVHVLVVYEGEAARPYG